MPTRSAGSNSSTTRWRFKLLFAPGDRRNYSNTGYALLAAVIEQVSGASYDEYVRENILIPIGLRSTGFHLPGFDDSRLARGYSAGGRDEGTLLSRPRAPDGPFWNLRGNGGMLSTVGDMHLFYEALFETDKLLKPATRDMAFPTDRSVMLAGSDLVSFFLYNREPAEGIEIIIASNSAEQKAPQIHRALAGALGIRLGVRDLAGPKGEPIPQRSGTLAPPELQAIAHDVVRALNSGDRERVRRMIAARFTLGPGDPSVEQRLERLGGVNANLGAMEVLGVTVGEGGELQIHVRTPNEGPAMIMLDIEPSSPHRIRRFGLMVGGD
ncbi:MAG: serine hydrolase domain-containing protein [Gemmatimonadaceae bacterium]